jgi:hypothetical protein
VLDVPVGKHTIWLQRLAVLLSVKVNVTPGSKVRVTADFDSKKVLTSVHAADPDKETDEIKKGKKGCFVYWVEIVRTSKAETIETTKEKLEEMGYSVLHMQLRIVDDDGVIPMYKLYLGPFRNHHSASRTRFQIRRKDFKSSRVIREACL